MKKTLIILALVASAVSSQAQGWVLFGNANNTKVSTNSVTTATPGSISTVTAGGAGLYYYALFSSLTTTNVGGSSGAVIGTNGVYAFDSSQNGIWAFNSPGFGPDYATNTPTTGRFATTVADPGNSQGTQVSSGASQSFVIIGWSANIGSTVASLISWYNAGNPAFTGWLGESITSGFITPGSGGLSTPATIEGTGVGVINGFTLGEVVPVPEPATVALAGLSGISLLLFRRRKA